MIDERAIVVIHRDDEITIQEIEGGVIRVIDLSTAYNSIADDVTHYVVEGIEVFVVEKDPRFEPYRFAYVNQNGGTDYINFSLADAEKLKIKRGLFENDNKEILYDTDVDQEFTCFSESMSEQRSKNLRYFWISPKIELIKDGVHYPVNIKTKSAPILNRESGLIFYNVTFTYEAKFNVQR